MTLTGWNPRPDLTGLDHYTDGKITESREFTPDEQAALLAEQQQIAARAAQVRFAAEVRATALAYRDRVTEWQQQITVGQQSVPAPGTDPVAMVEWARSVLDPVLDLLAEQMTLNAALVALTLHEYQEQP